MPEVGFEFMIPVFERTKTVYALGLAATLIGTRVNGEQYIQLQKYNAVFSLRSFLKRGGKFGM
jgi:hypothetical protein